MDALGDSDPLADAPPALEEGTVAAVQLHVKRLAERAFWAALQVRPQPCCWLLLDAATKKLNVPPTVADAVVQQRVACLTSLAMPLSASAGAVDGHRRGRAAAGCGSGDGAAGRPGRPACRGAAGRCR